MATGVPWYNTTAGAAGISAAGGLLGGIATGIYNASQARANRNFQREMYQRQYEDSIKFWQMQNQYSLPSAQVQRLKDANLNPLLYYSGGQIGQPVTPPDVPSQPSGAQASAAFRNPLEMAQYALLDAQRENIDANTRRTNVETDKASLDLRFGNDTYGIRMALLHHDDERLQVEMQKMRQEIYNSGVITSQQLQTMMQARQYEVKRYNLDEWYYGKQVSQGWESLRVQREQNRIAWGNLSALMLRIKNETNMTDWQTGRIAFDILWDSKMNPIRMRGLTLDNFLKTWDTHLRKATLKEKQVHIFNQQLKNYYYDKYGSETPFEYKHFKDVKAFANELSSMFTVAGKLHL